MNDTAEFTEIGNSAAGPFHAAWAPQATHHGDLFRTEKVCDRSWDVTGSDRARTSQLSAFLRDT